MSGNANDFTRASLVTEDVKMATEKEEAKTNEQGGNQPSFSFESDKKNDFSNLNSSSTGFLTSSYSEVDLNKFFNVPKDISAREGRKPKPINFDNEEIKELIRHHLISNFKKAEANFRSDSARATCLRAIKKIPLIVLHALVSKTYYKSHETKDWEKFIWSYLYIYDRLTLVLAEVGVHLLPHTP
jgi:hypothetical protein